MCPRAGAQAEESRSATSLRLFQESHVSSGGTSAPTDPARPSCLTRTVRTPPRTAQLVFEPQTGMFDQVTWQAPYLRWLRLATVVVFAFGLLFAASSGSWTSVVPLGGWILGYVAARRSRTASLGAGPEGVDAGRFAIPWDRVSRIDERGHVHLDPPARMSKAVALSGELRTVQLGRRGWQDRELGTAVSRWAPRLLADLGT